MARPNGRVTGPIVRAVSAAVAPLDPARVVVALGGGADSATLLAATCEAVDQPVRAVFADHGLDDDLEHGHRLRDAAAAVAEMLGVPVDVLPASVPDGPNLEARARTARYAAIEATLRVGDVALTAHTRDDQAETVLMRLASGAGATGLAGIPSVRGRWLRPLLGITKAELRAEADRLSLPYIDDPANDDDRFARSRIRHRVIPVLHAELGDHASEGLARSAELIERDDAALGRLAERIAVTRDGSAVRIAVAPLLTEIPAVAARACRRALRMVGDGYPGVRSDVEAILDTAETGRSHSLTGGEVAVREGPHVRIGPPPEPDPPVDLPMGETVAWSGMAITLHGDIRPIVAGGRFSVLDLRVADRGITIRGAADGDRLDIGVGTTPVAELLRAHGVPAAMRPVSPVALVGAKIGAVIGVRTAAWAAPAPGSGRAVIERGVGS